MDRNGRLYKRWDSLPRPRELGDLEIYRRGRDLHRRLWNEGYTMLGSRRGRTLYRLASIVDRDRIAGALVDCGVWNGGSTILMGAAAPERELWAFDTFQGLPAPSQADGQHSFRYVGECVGSETKLRQGVWRYADPARLHVRAGLFKDTLPEAAEAIDTVAVLHCDGDWYESVYGTLEVLYPRVSPGGFIVIDDYGTWPGARLATDEFRRHVGEGGRMRRVDHTGWYWRRIA